VSGRWAVVEDDNDSAWLYFTEPHSRKIVRACILYKVGSAPVHELDAGIHFRWSADGNSVAVLFGKIVMGFIVEAKPPCYSRFLKAEGPFGKPMDLALYERTFRAT